MYKRNLTLPLSETETCFLWGPRQTGKSTLLKTLFPNAKRYDLLLSNEYHRLLTNPGLIREECLAENKAYIEKNYPVSYWKTASGFEVDFVLGDHELAVEVKSASMVGNRHLKGVRAFKEEYAARHDIVVSMDPKPRKTADGIDILPWNIFLDRLWEGSIFQKS